VLVGKMTTADDAGEEDGREDGHEDGSEYAKEVEVVMAEGARPKAA
jgi:hypothetical protein